MGAGRALITVMGLCNYGREGRARRQRRGELGGVDDAAVLSLPLELIWVEVQDCVRVARSNKASRTG